MVCVLELWRFYFQIGFAPKLDTWMIQTERADYHPLISLQLATSYFIEAQEKLNCLQFICGPLMFGIGWISFCHLIEVPSKEDE